MCTSILKCFLLLFNVLVMIIAIVLIAGGVILAFVPSTVMEPAYKKMKAEADKDGYSIPESAKDLKDIPLVYNIGIALLAFGIFLFALSLLGWCGSCCTCCCKWMLALYAFIILVLMIVEIVVACFFFIPDSALHTTLREELQAKIKKDYKSDGRDSFSMSINLVNKYFECCGIDNSLDFPPPPPKSCKLENYNKGCYTKMTGIVKKNIIYAALGLTGVLLVQLLEMIFAVVVYKYDNKISPI